MDMQLLIWMGALLLAIGAFAGMLAGLLGVGGGIVLVPAFYYAFSGLGFDGPELMRLCLGTSLATIIVTSVRSLLSHNKKGAVDWQILRDWAPGIVVGAILGVLLVSQLQTAVLRVIFGGLAIVVGTYMAAGSNDWRLGPKMPDGPVRWALSPLLGFLSVLMGIGGGSFGVPVMSLYGVAIHRAVATAAGFGVIIAVPSVAGLLLSPVEPAPPFTVGSVNLIAFVLIIAMTLITAPFGAALAHKTDARRLKRVFGVFLIFVALNMLRKTLF